MFELDYKIIHGEHDEFIGQNGFFQIKCNDCTYGEIYPEELETIMETVSLYDWFGRQARVVDYLSTKKYVALSDVDSFNTWITFRRANDEIIVSVVKAEKENGSHDIEFSLKNPIPGAWNEQVIGYEQMKIELTKKLRMYMECISSSNKGNPQVSKIYKNFLQILSNIWRDT
jgi:hypothetical protein